MLIVFSANATTAFNGMKTDVLGKFRNTFYYYIDEKDYAHYPDKTAKITDLKGNVIATVAPVFKRDLSMEGSGLLIDGRMVNYIGRVNAEVRFETTVHPYGRGIGNCALIPYQTIAVDPRQIPLGSTVKIDKTVGLKLPNGATHDGIWRAEDVGGAIQGDRIDFFVGDDRKGLALDKHGITHLMGLTVRLVRLPSTDSCIHDDPR